MLLHWIREIVNHMNEDTAFIHIDYSRVFAKTTILLIAFGSCALKYFECFGFQSFHH